MPSAISTVDSKGRISIPIGLRAKLKLLEGSKVRILKRRKSLVIIPCSDEDVLEYGQISVRVGTNKSVKACEAFRAGPSPASGLKRGDYNER